MIWCASCQQLSRRFSVAAGSAAVASEMDAGQPDNFDWVWHGRQLNPP